jgi:hypothetical protein
MLRQNPGRQLSDGAAVGDIENVLAHLYPGSASPGRHLRQSFRLNVGQCQMASTSGTGLSQRGAYSAGGSGDHGHAVLQGEFHA